MKNHESLKEHSFLRVWGEIYCDYINICSVSCEEPWKASSPLEIFPYFIFENFLMAGCENVDMRWKNPTKRELANLESLKISRGEVISTWKNVKLKVLVTQPRPTLCDPMDCGPPGSSVHGILQTRVLEWLAIPSSRESSWPRDQTLLGVSVGVANQMVSCWIIISQIDFILAFSVCVYEL